MERIKGLRQKRSDSEYFPFMPFGTDGQYIDMISELNLEYELKLGPKHIASIENYIDSETGLIDDNITIIVENYATPSEVATPGKSYYQVRTEIDASGQSTEQEETYIAAVITATLYWMSNSYEDATDVTEKLIKGKSTTIYATEKEDAGGVGYTDYEIEEVYINN